jgi:hypothetical protein
MWRRKTAQRAQARLRFFVARAAQRAAKQLQSCYMKFGLVFNNYVFIFHYKERYVPFLIEIP